MQNYSSYINLLWRYLTNNQSLVMYTSPIVYKLQGTTTVKHEIFVALNFRGFQIFIILLHIIFTELTIDNTAVKFRCM